MEQKKIYAVLNALFLIAAAGFLVGSYKSNIHHLMSGVTWKHGLYLLFVVMLVHLIKCIRLYFLLAGKEISFIQHMRQYCKCMCVSMILPLKTGDIFRAYCYGYQIGNYAEGIIIIIFDRFVDILAIITISILMRIIYPYKITAIELILILFLSILVVCYAIFPGLFQYWNDYFIRAKAIRRNIIFLYCLDLAEHIHSGISGVCKQKFFIVYALSLVAWGIEISGLLTVGRVSRIQIPENISSYLMSSLTGTSHIFLLQFVFVSTVLLFSTYVIITGWIAAIGRGGNG